MYSSPSAAIRLSAWTVLNRMGVISLYRMVKLAWLIGGLYFGLTATMTGDALGGIIAGVIGFVVGTVGGVLLGPINGIVCAIITIVGFRPLHAPQDHYRLMLTVSAIVTGLGTSAELLVLYSLMLGADTDPSSFALMVLIPALLASVGGVWIGHDLTIWYRQQILREARMEQRSTHTAVFLDARLPDHAGISLPHDESQSR